MSCCAASTVVGHEDRDLHAVLDRLERRPERDLGLAVADVADDQPVHRPARLHVGLDLGDRPELVDRLLVRERSPPSRTARACPAANAWPRRRPATAYSSSSSSARSSTAFLTRCLVRSQSVPPSSTRVGLLAAGVAADPADLLDRDEDPVAAGEPQLEIVALLARPRRGGASARSGRRRGRCGRPGRPVVSRSRMSRGTTRRSAFGPPDADRAEQLAVGDHDKPVGAAD